MDAEGIEIRSFRSVFDLERRIYSVDRVRLNPAGVPVRGVVYVITAALLTLVAMRVPVLGAPLRVLPWWLAEVAAPCAVGSLLAILRIDGRPFHRFALSALALALRPRGRAARLSGGGRRGRWRPGSLIMLPDGSCPRALRYRGPGTVRIGAGHAVRARVGPRVPWRGSRAGSGGLVAPGRASASLLVLGPGVTLTLSGGG